MTECFESELAGHRPSGPGIVRVDRAARVKRTARSGFALLEVAVAMPIFVLPEIVKRIAVRRSRARAAEST